MFCEMIHILFSVEETMKYIQHLEERTDLLENQLRRQLEKSADNPWLSTSNISQAMKVH